MPIAQLALWVRASCPSADGCPVRRASARESACSAGGMADAGIEPAVARVQELEHLSVLVHDDDAAARTCGLAVRRGAGLPEAQKAHPVLGCPALESHVRGEHGRASIAAARARAPRSVNAEELFVRFFLPLYPADARADLARARATDANPANNAAVLAHLEDAAQVFVRNAPALFGDRRSRAGSRRHRRERPPPERGADARTARRVGGRGRAPAARRTRSSTRSCTARRTSAHASSAATAACGACDGRSGRASCGCSRAQARRASRSSRGG